MKLKLIILLNLIFSINLIWAQSKGPVSFPTPNAASLGIYGQIPVNYFNGLPNISVPIYTLKERDISIPIELSYHASGVRPDNHPGWVGLGWNLSAGGMITRIANGDADEIYVPTSESRNPNNRSYLYNYGLLANDNWYTSSILSPILQNYVTFPSPPTGSAIPSPDEFTFNFNGYSGSFFLDHTGTWRVRSSNGKAIKVALTTNSFELQTSPNYPTIPLARIIDKIVLTTPDGIIYTFGGTQESIEFSRNAGQRDETYNTVTATSWMLTKIIDLSGKEINFGYERGGYTVVNSDMLSSYHYSNGVDEVEDSNGSSQIVSSLLNPVYLKEISSENQTVIFERSQTNELKFPRESFYDFNNGQPDKSYADIGPEGSKWFKLNSIRIIDNFSGNDLSKFNFEYKDEPTSRLMLLSMQETDPSGLLSKNPYKFFYYDDPNISLPNYMSRKVDHWGFFNNVNFFENKPVGYQITPSDNVAYSTSRNTNPDFLMEGTLSHIFYPTGGQTEFTYEANDYSNVAKSYDSNPSFGLASVGPFGAKIFAGGLRIKKIISRTGDALPEVRQFSYNKSADTYPNISSGILGGDNIYFEELFPVNGTVCMGNPGVTSSCFGSTANYWHFSNHSQIPMSYTQGNHVTYSEVKEKFGDGGYKIYHYSNHDNIEYRNTPVLNSGYYYAASISNAKFTDMSYIRGKLLTEESYSSLDKLLQRTSFEYNNKSSRFDDYVRVADITSIQASHPIGVQLFAYKKYLFEPYLSKVTVDNYNQNDNNYVRSIKSYEYDDATNLLKNQKLLKSDNSELISVYKYPINKIDLNNTYSGIELQVIDEMVTKNIISKVLETEVFKDSKLLKRDNVVYGKYTFGTNSMFLPSLNKSRYADATEDNLEFQSYGYDSNGNILTYSSNNSAKTSFIWAYNKQLPVAKIVNAATNECFYEGFEEQSAIPQGIAHTGLKSKNGSFQVPFTRPNGRNYILTYWKYLNAKWVLYKQNYDNDNFIINESVPIDDISVYPDDASLSHYTYKPLVGISSQTDPTGKTFFYNYDQLSRLSNINDQNRDVIKSFTYQFANTSPNWQNTPNLNCEYLIDPEYNNQLGATGYKLQEQIDINPFSFTYNNLRQVRANFDPIGCPATYYFYYTTDPSLTGVNIYAKRSYDDNTNKTMHFRVRYDSLSYNGQQVEKYVDIPISGMTGSAFLSIEAGSYVEVELMGM